MSVVSAPENRFFTTEEISLSFSHVREHIQKGYNRPFLIVDSSIVRNKSRRFKASMPIVQPHFAVKSNPDPRVLKVLIQEGVGFEIASIAELDILLDLNVRPEEIFYSNPMKSRAYIEYAWEKGVKWYVIDSVEELEKVFSVSPEAKMYVRYDTSNVGSDWPLSGKFGAFPDEITRIIQHASELGAQLEGVTCHVGSQCLNVDNWVQGIRRGKAIFEEMREAGLTPTLMNLGGGYPVQHTKPIPSIETIASAINAELEDVPETIRVMAEPGRYLVSDAAYYVCRVVGTASRGTKRWIYWDAGVFGGVIETTEGLRYTIETDRVGEPIEWTVAGPTCDSVDICMRDVLLPCDLREGDFIYIKNSGAYTTAYASNFNGFPLPEVVVL
ncbi:MAG: type III PLP-dependent enzyme [Pseudomonadota bacterium]